MHSSEHIYIYDVVAWLSKESSCPLPFWQKAKRFHLAERTHFFLAQSPRKMQSLRLHIAVDDATKKRGYRLVGDVDFAGACDALGEGGAITPVPGGVGPMTIAMLLQTPLFIKEPMHLGGR